MRCAGCARMLGLYVGGDLPAKDAGKVAEYLAGCETCRALLDGLARSRAALEGAALTEEMLPAQDPAYWHEVESKLRGRALEVEHLSSSGSWWVRVPRVLAQAAVVLAAAGVVLWLAVFQSRHAVETEQAAVLQTTPRPMPVVVLLRPSDPYRQAARTEVYALPTQDNDVNYSDTGHVVSPGEVRRFTQQVLPAAMEQEDPSRF